MARGLLLVSNPSTEALQTPIQVLGGLILLLWVLELVDTVLLSGRLNALGIRPRRWIGLRGIVFAPLLHGDLKHLAANTIPLAVLGGIILLGSLQTFGIVTGVAWLVSGLGTWLFGGRNTNHLGASGLVFGYFGFLVWRGWFERSAEAIAIAAIVGLLYGSLIWGVLPLRRGKSWQGHLFGFIGGGLAARYLPDLQQRLHHFL